MRKKYNLELGTPASFKEVCEKFNISKKKQKEIIVSIEKIMKKLKKEESK